VEQVAFRSGAVRDAGAAPDLRADPSVAQTLR
jgi:hypothetical protein